jgi:hypothetical protein
VNFVFSDSDTEDEFVPDPQQDTRDSSVDRSRAMHQVGRSRIAGFIRSDAHFGVLRYVLYSFARVPNYY